MKLGWFISGWFLAVASLLFSAAALAQDPERPQVAAATASAMSNLRSGVGHEMLTRRLSIAEFVRLTGGSDEFLKALEHAEVVGGPRWLDSQTCQVQLEVGGARLGRALVAMAAANPRACPLSSDILVQVTAALSARKFEATGSSTGALDLELHPHHPDLFWTSVPDDARVKAITAARDDAVAKVVDSLRGIVLTEHAQVTDALAVPEINKALVEWLVCRPVTRVIFHRDMEVEVMLAAAPDDAYNIFRGSVTAMAAARPELAPAGEQAWGRVHRDWVTQMALPLGRAAVVAQAIKPPSTLPLPSRAPVWADIPLAVKATAVCGRSKLQSARQAEAAARDVLRQQVEALPLAGDATFGSAAQNDQNLRDLLTRFVAEAPIVRTDYGAEGALTTVRITLDTHALWEAVIVAGAAK